VCRYTTLWNVKCLKSHNWKQDDFCNNTLHMLTSQQQGTTCLLSQLLSKVTVTSCRSSAGISCTDICGRTARRHTLRGTHRRTCELRRENVTFIEPHMWPPNSPDLNAVDCAVCCPSTDGLSTSTIQDNQPAEAGNRHWVGQMTVGAFHRWRHLSC